MKKRELEERFSELEKRVDELERRVGPPPMDEGFRGPIIAFDGENWTWTYPTGSDTKAPVYSGDANTAISERGVIRVNDLGERV